MMHAKVLRLSKAGVPLGWLTRQQTATLISKDQVVWTAGEISLEIRGGWNHQGLQSVLSLPSIIACEGRIKMERFTPPLMNSFLFRRDQYMCLYCGKECPVDQLSRDHVIPTSRQGSDTWTNVVTACKRCNQRKADRTPEEANMHLLAVPFIPNRHEFLYLANKNVLADQMEFLKSQFSKHARLKPMR